MSFMNLDQVAICVKSRNHELPATIFWLGFVIHHGCRNADGLVKAAVSAIEIISLNLSVNNRQNGAFYYPVELRNRFRINPEVMFQYLIEIRGVNDAFARYMPVSRIDFLYATKNGCSIGDSLGEAIIDFMMAREVKTIVIDQAMASSSALCWRIANGGVREVLINVEVNPQPIEGWTGDIDDYIARLSNHELVPTAPVKHPTNDPAVAKTSTSGLITLGKGVNVVLPPSSVSSQLHVTLSWNVQSVNLDLCAFLIGGDGKAASDEHFIFFNQPCYGAGVVELEPDHPKIRLDLERLPDTILRIAFCASIDGEETHLQNFGQVTGLRITVSQDDGTGLVYFELPQDYETETAMIVGEIYRYQGKWKFKAIGQGYSGGLKAMCGKFGIETT